ncbi:murein biosynthesis integral membrane protein MurJ [Candidatus Sneabacter namystus]|uniref:Probable lipid II flippase MurJ n=1 Tax=Candidatus Sneabacter namystus TaxID=2601646 RepID=A0A5C0UIS7_9RICK|nr:murein biosynthesis integral membrane protein MurJ [Candidatus Sneabacter namystus]QEK39521.1 murein biosynthesis integral membrane protein MurJ [Candidatus Sneabacter namystus]
MRSLVKSSVIVVIGTVLCKILGLVRELYVASTFGSSNLADVVNVVLRLPNFFRRIFSEGALSSVFIPVFNAKSRENKKDALIFANQIFFYLLIFSGVFVILVEIFMPVIASLLAPGFIANSDQLCTTVRLCRVSIPYLFFVTLVGFLSSVLNSYGYFFAASINPSLMSIGVIAAMSFTDNVSVKAKFVPFGLVIAGILQLSFVMYNVRCVNIGVPKRVSLTENSDSTKKFLCKLLPAGMASGATQIQIIISQSIASFFPGAISILGYAERIYQFPLSLLGVICSSVLLPAMSKINVKYDSSKISHMQMRSIKLVSLISFPCAIGMAAISIPIVQCIYQHGNFSFESTKSVAITFSLFALGLPAFVLIKLFNNLFYVYQDTKTLFRVTCVSIVINTLANIILIQYMGYFGISLGSSLISWVQLIWLVHLSVKKKYLSIKRYIIIWCLEVFFISSVMGGMLHVSYLILTPYFNSASFFVRLILTFGLLFLGIITYLCGVLLFGKISIGKRSIVLL